MAYPKLRFSEFKEEWKKYRLSEIFTQRKTIQCITEDAPLLSFTIEQGVIDPEDKKTNKRDFLIKDKENKKFLLTEYNDIIYNPANLKFGAIHRNKFGKGVVSPIYVTFTTKQNPIFMEYLVRTDKFIKMSQKYVEGTVEKLRTLKAENFLMLEVYIPISMIEQEKIANILFSVDEMISMIESEIAVWEEKKKGMMQKVFLQEARFKKENGFDYQKWEEQEIRNLGEFTKGASLSKADISETGTPFILYGELYTTYNEVAYEIKRKTKAIVEDKYYSKIGDVVIPTSGESAEEISTSTCVMKEGVILAGDLNIFRSDVLDGRIMSYILNYQVKNKIAKIAQGKSIVHVQAKELGKIKIQYPVDKEEQEKIAEFFSIIDEVIEIKKQKLEIWKNIKKGLLQQMFV